MIRRVLAVLALVVVLASCQLDAAVDVSVDADGTGTVALTVTVDADVVAQVPGLAGALTLDDATAQGWTAQGPTATDDGGLTVSLAHPFSSTAEASNLLNSLGPPFTGIALAQTADPPTGEPDTITTTLSGSLTLPGGTFDAFADSDLLAAIGATPFGTQLAAAEATPSDSMSIRLTVALPGEVVDTTGHRVDGGVRWDAPLDGSTTDLATTAVLGGSGGGGWADTVATVALVLLVLWLIAAVVLAVLVVRARRRRAARRRYR